MSLFSQISLERKRSTVRVSFWLAVLLLTIMAVMPASAQIRSSSPVVQLSDSIVQAAREDTTYALQRLFFEQRKKNLVYGAVMFPVVLFSGLRTFSIYTEPNSKEKRVTTSIVSIGYLMLFARRLQLIYRYRAGRERKLELTLQENKPLPYKIRRALKKDYFSTPVTGK
jgi:hypothetical protein